MHKGYNDKIILNSAKIRDIVLLFPDFESYIDTILETP